MRPYRQYAMTTLVGGLLMIGFSACKRHPQENSNPVTIPTATVPAKDLLVFPDALHVEDVTVNAFVEKAMIECATGNYDRFRRLWSVREKPLSREEYNHGWKAVIKIEVRTLQPVMITPEQSTSNEPTEKVYALMANVDLDPEHRATQGEPHREVVLVVRREHDSWRLSRAPKPLREWLKKHIEEAPNTKP